MTGRRKLRIGLVGCGRVAERRHLPALERLPAAEVVALADPDPDRLRRLGDRWGIAGRYENHTDLLADPAVEAVGVLTPTASHAEIGVDALEADKHVFLEKPLALTHKDSDRLVAAAEASSRAAVLCFNLRWHRLIRQARTWVRAGRLGRVKGVRSLYTHFRPDGYAPDWHRRQALGGGVTSNEAVHHIDLWRYLLEDEPIEVVARIRPLDGYEDESSVISARLASGVLCTAFNTLRTAPSCEIDLFGEAGSLRISLYRFDGLHFQPADRYPGSMAGRLRESVGALKQLPGALAAAGAGGDFAATFRETWRHFLACAIDGGRPECTFADGLAAFRVTEAALESARSGEARRIAPGPAQGGLA